MNLIAPVPKITIDREGVYDLAAEVYHADPVVDPSLSSSIAHVLLEQSPAHAWLLHPRLNPDHQAKHKTIFDLGSAAHKMILGKGAELYIVEADDWKTKAAREERDSAREQGMTPILAHQHETALAMADAMRKQLARHEDAAGAFSNGKAEQTLVWREGETWCRCMLDWLPNGGNVFFDLKSTGTTANPDVWGERTLFDIGADIQTVLYRRGIKAVLGIEQAHFRFLVVENAEPFALSSVELTPAAIDMAERQLDEALAYWRWCTKHDRWPGYPKRTCYVNPPPWRERRWLEREERSTLMTEAGEDLRRLALEWQRPLGVEGEKPAA